MVLGLAVRPAAAGLDENLKELGSYVGRTFQGEFTDAASGRVSVAFYYFTTAGFFTHGTMTLQDGIYTAAEKVEGGSEGITEVRSTSRVLEDGRLHLASEYLQNDQWVPGHEIFNVEAPDAKVIFK